MTDRRGKGDAERAGEDKQGFLKRWSRRKLEEAERQPPDPEPPAEAPPAEPAQEITEAGASAPEAEPEEPFDPADLPDIDSLDKDSDYTGFLKEGVPAKLRHMALQKLFRSDPALAVLDGLNDYDEDFTLSKVAEKIVSSYKPGRGYVDDEDDEDETEDIETGDIEDGDIAASEIDDGDIEDGDIEDGDAEATERAAADEPEKGGRKT